MLQRIQGYIIVLPDAFWGVLNYISVANSQLVRYLMFSETFSSKNKVLFGLNKVLLYVNVG